MYHYNTIFNKIYNAIDTDDVEKLMDEFFESISLLYLREKIIDEFYNFIKVHSKEMDYDKKIKIKRAFELIETYKSKDD